MRRLINAIVRMTRLPADFDPRGRPLAFGRSLIAVAELSAIVFTPNDLLFMDATMSRNGARCSGIHAAGLWCITGISNDALTIGRLLAIGTLCLVASGFRPQWTCIPHWYVTFSFTSSIVPYDGGDRVAQVVTMLLVLICLGDTRRWHWTPPVRPLTPRWQGISFAVLATLRVQIVAIYLIAIISKLRDQAWQDGSALRILAANPSFGPHPLIGKAMQTALSWPWFSPMLTWSVITLQGAIVILICSGRRARSIALALGVIFHIGIVVILRLPSFGLVMIGLLLIVCVSQKVGAISPRTMRRGLAEKKKTTTSP
ncbi:sporulation-delaying protein SdpB family protein [Actinoplanes regularis]|uniref:Antimicrobial peptide system protein, SdpB family n=1 Tax=Actinoplanes regularis TaxID=52697 RepID=A0A238X8U7_9ACTN|nr:sporulation-delaying protein SdpB family protein [Actinoplanes regularis]SNR54259.1 antimicrobial peptide system protein, SdpB family [Actinoplanes regularis]